MKRPIAHASVLVAVLAAPALAQRAAPSGPSASGPSVEATDRYHEAARLYVDGQNAPALAAAEAAVALDPGDARAVALRDLLKQKQDDQNPPPDDPGDSPSPPPPPDDGGEDDPGQNDPGQNGSGETPPPAPPPGEVPQSGPNEMSREQAERLLDAVGGDERLLLQQMRRPPSRVRTNDQDW